MGQTRPNLDVWVAEYSCPSLQRRPWFEIADVCVENLRDSDVFIALLYRRGGNKIWLNERLGTTEASYFELELVHASLLSKPAFFFSIDGFDPHFALLQVLGLVRRSTRSSQWSTA